MSIAKRKEMINYRQARISRDGHNRNCEHCSRFRTIKIHNCSTGEFIKWGSRCAIIGLCESRRYAIALNHVCDKFEMAKI